VQRKNFLPLYLRINVLVSSKALLVSVNISTDSEIPTQNSLNCYTFAIVTRLQQLLSINQNVEGANMGFGPILKQIRERNGLSQEDVARVIGVSRTTVSDIERDKRDIEYGEMRDLAAFLCIDVVDLLNVAIAPQTRLGKYCEMLMQAALSFREATGKDIPKTFLAKLTYLADFAWFYQHLEPMCGMTYYRREFGPVANEYFTALGTLVDEGHLQTINGKQAQWYRPVSLDDHPFSPQYLSIQEIELINQIVEKWKGASTREIVEFTHSQLPWQICLPNEAIPYSLITQEEPEHVF
jgi:transcriptional regulator with XRE-family HTH domain